MLDIGRNINTSTVLELRAQLWARNKRHIPAAALQHTKLSKSDLTHHISIRIVPWWHLRREVPLCWRADKSGGAGRSNRVSAWGGVTAEPAAQRTCAPRLTVRPRHGSKGVKICTGISQIRFCSKVSLRPAELSSLLRRCSAPPCASDRFLRNQTPHFDPKFTD